MHKMAFWKLKQAVKSSADPRNSAFFFFGGFSIIFEISVNLLRNLICHIGGGLPQDLRNQNKTENARKKEKKDEREKERKKES